MRSFNAAITRQAKKLAESGMGHLIDNLPDKVTVQGIMDRVSDINDFRRIVGYANDWKRRPSELQRILKKVDPSALEFTDEGGILETVFDWKKHRRNIASIRRRRAKIMRDMGVDFDEMGPQERAALTSDNDMMDDDIGERDESWEDVDAETKERWRREDSQAKRESLRVSEMYELWMRFWESPSNMHQVLPGYSAVVDAMEWLRVNRPDVLNIMFEMGADELTPAYLVDSGKSNPYINIPFETRHSNVVDFVTANARRVGWK